MNRGRDERGVGTVLTLGMALILAGVTAVGCVLIAWFALIRHAEQAAELAALAGAGAAVQGGDPCEAAARAARENDARISRCEVRGEVPDVVVEVGVTVQLQPQILLAPEEVERLASAATM